jgi:hypothetical protein
MPETSFPGTSWPGLPAASQKFAPTVLGVPVWSKGDGLGFALPAGGEMAKFAKGHRATLVASHLMLGWMARCRQRLCSSITFAIRPFLVNSCLLKLEFRLLTQLVGQKVRCVLRTCADHMKYLKSRSHGGL